MMAAVKTLNSFPKERCVIAKELSKARKDGSRAYGVGPYFLSKVLIEGEFESPPPLP